MGVDPTHLLESRTKDVLSLMDAAICKCRPPSQVPQIATGAYQRNGQFPRIQNGGVDPNGAGSGNLLQIEYEKCKP